MAKRRGPRVVWLPVSRENRINATGAATSGLQNAGFAVALDVPTPDTPDGVTLAIPVVADNPQNLALTGNVTTLSDIENSGYRLRRIVGKIVVQVAQVTEATLWKHCQITCGFIILRVGPDGQPLTFASTPDAYSVASIDSNSDPWIWRRSFWLGNNAAIISAGVSGENFAFWPETNLTAGSALDGPHVDQKTARIIGPEERLFFVATGVGLDSVAQQTLVNTVRIFGDIRVLASMRTTSGNRRNASR